MPAAARRGDSGRVHCSAYVIADGSSNVFVNGRSLARVGDSSTPHKRPGGDKCVVHTAAISKGSSSVFINGKPAARQGDPLAGCTNVATGSPNVFIG